MTVDAYVSHDFPFQSLSGNEILVDMRANSERTNYSNSIGARFGFTFPNGFGIKSGINISTVRTTFTYTENDGMGGTVIVNPVSITNKYRYVDIPLLFSLEKSGFGPFYYNFNAGVLFNMTLSAEGNFLDINGNVATFTSGELERVIAYEKSVGTSLFASFGLHYYLNDMFDIVIEPNIRYSLSHITRSDYPVDEKYTTVGLITGIRYKF